MTLSYAFLEPGKESDYTGLSINPCHGGQNAQQYLVAFMPPQKGIDNQQMTVF